MEYMDDANSIERMLMNKATENNTPINGSIELLPLCNMNCNMCYVKLTNEEMNKVGRLRTVNEWLEIAKEMQEAGVLFLLLTGGEPLLYPGFKELYLELKKIGMIITINTNGTLINEEWVEFFAKNKPRRINITLYGSSEDVYNELCHYPQGYSKVINAIQLLKNNNIDVKIGGSLTESNKNDIDNILQIGNSLDIPVRIDTYMLPAIRERSKPYNMQSRCHPIEAAQIRIKALKEEMGNDLFKQYVKRSLFEVENIITEACPGSMTCNAGKCSFTINWQGQMRPCVIMSEPTKDVFEYGFKKAWDYICKEVRKIKLSSECNACKMKTICRTCGASALLETGSYEGTPQYMCDYTLETLRLLRLEENHEENI